MGWDGGEGSTSSFEEPVGYPLVKHLFPGPLAGISIGQPNAGLNGGDMGGPVKERQATLALIIKLGRVSHYASVRKLST